MLVLPRPGLMPHGEGGFEKLEIRCLGEGDQPPIRKPPRPTSSCHLVHEQPEPSVHDPVIVRLGNARQSAELEPDQAHPGNRRPNDPIGFGIHECPFRRAARMAASERGWLASKAPS